MSRGTAAASFALYEGSAGKIANEMQVLLDSGAKILNSQLVCRELASETEYAMAVTFVPEYFHTPVYETADADARSIAAEGELEGEFTDKEEERKFAGVDMSPPADEEYQSENGSD